MRILLITGEFPPMQGGVGDFTREMARAFVQQGHDVWVLVPDTLQDSYRSQAALPWHVLATVPNWKWSCWQHVIATINDIRPHIVNIQYQAAAYDMRHPAINLLPWRLSRLQDGRPPIVVTFHDLQTPYLFPKAGPIRAWAVRMLAHHSDASIVTNAEDLIVATEWRFFRPTRSRSHSPQLVQIPIGSNIAVDPPDGFRRNTWRAQLGYNADDFVWAYFGFLNESKGGDTLLRALASAPTNTKLLMIGGRVGSSDPTNKDYAAHIEALADELGIQERIKWTGYIPPREVSAALLSIDAVILPYRDGISFRRGSLHAALGHGCAIISTTPRVPLPELRHNENIVLVPPDDPQAICSAALALQQNAALHHKIGQGAKTLAREFTWEQIANRTLHQVFLPLGAIPRNAPENT
ncbi:MAG: glycosyltransferase family 4 protein [Anaerolineae bacterium]|nr:glycosyltransferase family 4 protein [Anaerolineae bacterium]